MKIFPSQARKNLPALVALVVILAGCDWTSSSASSRAASPGTGSPARAESAAAQPVAEPAPDPVVAPAGAVLRVRLNSALDTNRNRPGDRFTAVLESPVMDGSRLAIPRGALAKGHVVAARDSGRLKGRAVLQLALDSVEWNNRVYPVETSLYARASQNHKKRNWALIGGGSGLGAIIGALAGGGKGAAIGAGAGAAAGTTGAALTGKREVRLPAESIVSFRLRRPVTIS